MTVPLPAVPRSCACGHSTRHHINGSGVCLGQLSVGSVCPCLNYQEPPSAS